MSEGTTIGSLFSGIGGLELGLERAGLGPTVWQVEADPFCRRVLAKHWPGAGRYDDVRTARDLAPVDIVCGGFPCQDLSIAGSGAGLDGARSGLWFEYLRIVRALRPRFVVVENVPALLTRGLGVVLGGLAASGYDAQWDCIPAQAVGAPHRRDRVFVIATAMGDPDMQRRSLAKRHVVTRSVTSAGGATVGGRLDGWPPGPKDRCGWKRAPVASQPAIRRVAHGVSRGVDRSRLRALGNAVVPQVAEVIGRAIVGML